MRTVINSSKSAVTENRKSIDTSIFRLVTSAKVVWNRPS
ncbi:unnamed protein product [Strongylus vulgaris]|uniref:Uncharacterized protein n=1 Tax=Strongylus vulgaris TaxID=40348 RepID=A0A3P7KTG2_STRVU|nr:unnamed protein product [Strongylus vulgaris]